ncbi:hypothetical protein KY285_026007 [Solanum tuberosum]|nr:hypothetical protein KY285_026007 [Solanum tuberosum]
MVEKIAYYLSVVIYVAIFKALQTSPSVVATRLVADNLICIVFFTTLFALASKIPTEATQSTTGMYIVQMIKYFNAPCHVIFCSIPIVIVKFKMSRTL